MAPTRRAAVSAAVVLLWAVQMGASGAQEPPADARPPPAAANPPPSSDAKCQQFFGAIQGQLSRCKDRLSVITVGKHSDCPAECHGMFSGLPDECAMFVNRTLPESYKGPPAAGTNKQPFDICDRMYCPEHLDECGVPLDLLRSLDLFRLPYLVGGVSTASDNSGSSDGSSVNVGAIVAGVVLGNAAIAALVGAVLLCRRRHKKRRRALAATAPPGLPGSAAFGSSKAGGLEAAETGEGQAGIPAAGKATPPKGVSISAMALGGGRAAALPPNSDGGSEAGQGGGRIGVGAPGSPFGVRATADAWAAAAAQGAAAAWAAPTPAPSAQAPLSAAAALAGHMQQDELEMMHLDSSSSPDAQSIVRSDPLLSWVDAQLQLQQQPAQQAGPALDAQTPPPQRQASRLSRGAGTPVLTPSSSASSQRRSSGLVDLKPWQLKYSDLRMQRPLGEGSFGKVFLATWNETLVAVKVLLSTDAAKSGSSSSGSLPLPVVDELQKEAGLMASLRHPNVVLFLGVCASPPAVVTEYCSRGSLLDVLRNAQGSEQAMQQLTWVRRLSMALDAAKGMLCLHAHSPPILHRDLKSPNLLVDAAWRVKVCDFNLSKLMEDSVRSSSAGGMLNPRWLAPEVLMGQPATAASDVFSFGTVLWELLTWQLPWEGANLYQLVFMVSRGERLPIPEQLPGVDQLPAAELEAFLALIRRCWAQEPAERPNFAVAISELRAIMSRLLAAGMTGLPSGPLTPV